ncbi:MAG: BolA/IbaG family iron-sulfur metabolism protein [Gammaproteobacteria bacterium]|jgi:BolA family transcriptional regulator, general stress-responsive regulator|nr:BolA/IbaG family iron-sulfur metabolism protein [Gammaproteobacteria bacterium]
MNVEEKISSKLKGAFEPIHLKLLNESHMHAGTATESHFNLLLVSQSFTNLKKVQRHQAVYKLLSEELAGPVHALALHLYSPEEWAESENKIIKSPNCEGKNN